MAPAAAYLSGMADCLLPLPTLEPEGNMASCSSCAACFGAPENGTTQACQCRMSGQSKRQNQSVSGVRGFDNAKRVKGRKRRVQLEIVAEPGDQKSFAVQPRRWVVEHTFSWFSPGRRLSLDYEKLTQHSEAMIWIALSRVLIRRLA